MDFSPLCLSTDQLPERERIPYWRDVVSRNLLRVEMEPVRGLPFRVEARLRALPGLKTMSCATHALSMHRTKQLISDNTDQFGLAISTGGTLELSQRGRSATLNAGDAIAISNTATASLALPKGGRYVGLLVPCAALAALMPDFEDFAAKLIPGDNEALRLFAVYLKALTETPLAAPEVRERAVAHVHELLVLALRGERSNKPLFEGAGVRAARLASIKADVIAHANSPRFGISFVATRNRLSARTIQLLFESESTTFSRFLLEQRLMTAYRMLREKRYADMTVGAIAFASGFGDISHFNRNFRRRFGRTPSDARVECV